MLNDGSPAPARRRLARIGGLAGGIGRGGLASVLAVAVLGLGANNASAGAFGVVAPSTGLTATLLAVFAMKGWPSSLAGSGLSTAGGALLIAAVLAWWLPMRVDGFGATLRMRVLGAGRRRFSSNPSPVVRPVLADGGANAEFTALFVRIHRAWERGGFDELRECTTASLLAELIDERAAEPADREARATVFTAVDVEIVEIDRLDDTEVASVAFSGMLREHGALDTTPFRELWLLTRRVDVVGAGTWRLARHLTLY